MSSERVCTEAEGDDGQGHFTIRWEINKCGNGQRNDDEVDEGWMNALSVSVCRFGR